MTLGEIVAKLPQSYYQDDLVTIYHGDCRDILPSISGISAVVTDPPYELGFMGKSWDSKGISFQVDTWRLVREACLPGAMLLSFGGTRTSHRIACAIEDAGWQIRDTICWVYGSGFPKSLSIGKSIDKQKGAKREIIGITEYPDGSKGRKTAKHFQGESLGGESKLTTPATPEAKLWENQDSALKPAYEPIILAMKPLDGTFANNALKYKVAGLNIDKCRVEGKLEGDPNRFAKTDGGSFVAFSNHPPVVRNQARFPANFIHDGSQEVMELFPNTKSQGGMCNGHNGSKSSFGIPTGHRNVNPYSGDSGSAARFFYTAKASRRERDAGLEDMPDENISGVSGNEYMGITSAGKRKLTIKNNHPTVKPLALMTYLCKLVKMPEYNLILDPFCGSGTTLLACKKLGIKSIGIESSEEYCEIASKRCSRDVMKLDNSYW